MEGLDFEVIEGRDDSHLPNPEGEGFGGYGLAKTADEEGETRDSGRLMIQEFFERNRRGETKNTDR